MSNAVNAQAVDRHIALQNTVYTATRKGLNRCVVGLLKAEFCYVHTQVVHG